MVDRSHKVHQRPSMPAARAKTLAEYCPDLAQWPQRWQIDPSDSAVGRCIVDFLTPFLLHLLDEGLATNTLHRHRDNLWMLGGELIRRRYEDDKLKNMSVAQAIAELIEEDGGPLIWPRVTEDEQNSFDATCRKLYKHLNSTTKPAR